MTADRQPRPGSRFLLAAAVCLVIGALGGLLTASVTSSEASPPRFEPPREEPAGFRLRDQEGRWTTPETARGRVLAITWVFASCREVCPRQAQMVGEAARRIGGGVEMYMMSVDPLGDNPETARAFLKRVGLQGPRVRYLMGSHAQLSPVWQRYGIVPVSPTKEESAAAAAYAKELGAPGPPTEEDLQPVQSIPSEPPPAALEEYPDAQDLEYRGPLRHGYLAFEHSAYVMLVDKHGRQRVGIPHEQLDVDLLARDMRMLAAEP